MAFPTPNSDEDLVSKEIVNKDKPKEPQVNAPFIGNFHKTLPHNKFGEVDRQAYRKFERTCLEIEAGSPLNFDEVPTGPLAAPNQTDFAMDAHPSLTGSVAKFTSPLAGASTETLGPDPKDLEMLPAPSCRSISTMAETAELYWMAVLRDAPLLAFQEERGTLGSLCADIDAHTKELKYVVSTRVCDAQKSVKTLFDCALSFDGDPGKLRAPLDVHADASGADISLQTLFRSGLQDEEFGPLVSQYFLQSVGYGVQTIDQSEYPYIAKHDFLTTHGDWLLAQNTGKDKFGRDYGTCNNFSDQLARGAKYYPTDNSKSEKPLIKRHISTMRDLARFVNRDALHQAYFNAALFLLGINAPLDEGNPYGGERFAREGGFATLGGPDLLTLVSEVASRALKVVWRQKWLVHRRLRPEAMAGLIHMQLNGLCGETRDYRLPIQSADCPDYAGALKDTFRVVSEHNREINGGEATLFLPMAFSAGSPAHPAYGAGHATVAGACVTVLKAWFKEDATLLSVYQKANDDANVDKVGPKDPPPGDLKLLQPGFRQTGGDIELFCPPSQYSGSDADRITVGGELNKIASNVAMGRSMGGVHFRSDNTRSLRLGEQIAIEILRKRTAEYAERPVSFTFRSFDRKRVHITQGQVRIDN